MEEKKIVVNLIKQPLESERKEKAQKRRKKIIGALIGVILFVLLTAFGCVLGIRFASKTAVNPVADKVDMVSQYLQRYWLYASDYEDLATVLEDKALYGVTDFVDDPYTSYMSTEELESFTDSINMDYVGIGVSYNNHDGIATVIKVFKNSPAEKAGMMQGDIIKSVDGVDIQGFDSEEIRSRVLGEEGTTVNIRVIRDGNEVEMAIVRGAVNSTAYAETKDDIVILEISSFGVNTAAEIMDYLDDYQDFHKLIIDLRNDSGGYQTAVLEIAGLFIGPDKVVMQQVYNDGSIKSFDTTASKYYSNFEDIVILTNGSTASAAEVLAICLKEQHPNVTLMGETSYGKGVVQSTYNLPDGSALKMTTSKWLSPNGVWVNGEGIKPDVEVLLDPILYEQYFQMADDDSYNYDSVSSYVRIAQMGLKFLGYDVARTDGYFDKSTENAIAKYQLAKGFEATGTLDKSSYTAIISSVTYSWSMDESKDLQMLEALKHLSEN